MSTFREDITSIARSSMDNSEYTLNITQEDPDRKYKNERFVIDSVTARINERLVQEKLPLADVVAILHQVAAGGKETDDGELIEGGEFRNHEVAVGSVVPPKHEDVPKLMKLFLDKLDQLLVQATEKNIDALSVWAFLAKSSIHAFPDGNGRAGRGFMDYLRTSFQVQHGLAIEHISLPSGQEMTNTKAGEILEQVCYIIGLMPSTLTEPTAIDLYIKYKDEGKPEEYFEQVKKSIVDHIASIKDVTAFENDERFKKLQEFIQFAYSKNKYQTRPLAVGETMRRLNARLDKEL